MIPDVFHLVHLTSVPLHLTDIKERHMVHREIANRDFSRQFAHPGGDSHHPVQHDPDKGKINTLWWRRLYICERGICYSPVQKTFLFFWKKKNSINFFFKWDPCSSKQMRERAQGCDINEVLYRILCISDCFPLWKLSCKMFLSLNVLSLSLDVTFYIVVHSELSTLFSVPEMIIWCSFNSWPYTNFSSNSPVLGGIQGIRDHNVFTQN